MATHINELLNNIGLREQFGRETQEMIREKFHPDPKKYHVAYRESVEHALLLDLGIENEMEE